MANLCSPSPDVSEVRVQTRELPTADVVWQVQICVALSLPFLVFVKGLHIPVKSDVWTECFVCRQRYTHDSNVTRVYFVFRWRRTSWSGGGIGDRLFVRWLQVLSCSFVIMAIFRGFIMSCPLKVSRFWVFIYSVQSSCTCCRSFEDLTDIQVASL